jgi:hypothetical protein
MKQIDNEPFGYVVEDAPSFLQYESPVREFLLAPWLTTQSLNMIYAWRGVGKTHMAIAHSIATGTEFLGWKPAQQNKVLYIDGEMPINALQERLHNYNKIAPINKNLSIFSSDMQKKPMPDLATTEGQRAVDDLTKDDIKLIIIDNLSCLVSGRENDAESWNSIAKWAIAKRSEGKAILFIHHSGKDGNQRGTSKREDILDTVISLKSPMDYNSSQGARFEVHFEKARHLYGEDIHPFTACLKSDNNEKHWTAKPINTSSGSIAGKILLLHDEGLAASEITKKLNINRSTVYRHLKNR